MEDGSDTHILEYLNTSVMAGWTGEAPILCKGYQEKVFSLQQFSIRNLRNAVNLANAKEL
jgi:hypothetical protein